MVLIFGRVIPDNIYYSLIGRLGQYIHALLITFGIILSVLFLASFVLKYDYNVNILYISLEAPLVHVTSREFLSVALDSAVIANNFKNFNVSDPRLKKLMKPLSPAYLRVGGNMADKLIFIPDASYPSLKYKLLWDRFDGGECSYATYYCQPEFKQNFTMSAKEWFELNMLVRETGFELIFDLNALLRFGNGSWDFRNAESLIQFSNVNNLNVNWELGNEPNAFPHQFNTYVSPKQLAYDFVTLRNILDEYPRYRKSFLVGPDVTRPQEDHKHSLKYLNEFLLHSNNSVSAVTWHQYYFSGRFAKPHYYVDYKLFDLLIWQIETIKNLTTHIGVKQPIWLGETADAWGGGAEDLSDAYISTFIWLDKLGLAAKMGLDVVIRQSIVEGHYALIDRDYAPSPNWWLSVLYKMFVGPKVVTCHLAANPNVRFYCHCSRTDKRWIIAYGMNLQDTAARLRIQTENGVMSTRIEAYILTAYVTLFSSKVNLNSKLLQLTDDYDLPDFEPKVLPTKPYIVLPPYSIIFLKIPMKNTRTPCHD